MIPRYRIMAERIRNELTALEKVVDRVEGALQRSEQMPQDREYFLAAAALDIHSFYSGLERIFELIAVEMDTSKPSGSQWHRDLLAQMRLNVSGVRPPVLSDEVYNFLDEYREFRHVIRNVYSFDLRTERVVELARSLHPAFEGVQHDLLAFAAFLDTLSTADQE